MTHVYELDGRQLASLPEAHDYLAQMLGFPDYYGKNLDALYDLLTGQGEETLVWILHAEAMHPKLEQVFTDATADNEHFTALFMAEDEDDAAEDCGTEE